MGFWNVLQGIGAELDPFTNNTYATYNPPKKQQQQQNNQPVVNQKVNLPIALQSSGSAGPAPAPNFNIQSVDNSNLTAQPVTPVAKPVIPQPTPLNNIKTQNMAGSFNATPHQVSSNNDPVGRFAQGIMNAVTSVPRAGIDTGTSTFDALMNNPTASLNAANAAQRAQHTAVQTAQGLVSPIIEAGMSLDPTQQTYQPGGRLATDILGNTPIQNVEKNVASNFDTSQGSALHRVASAALNAIGQGAKIATTVLPVIKGAGALGDVARGDSPAFSVGKPSITTEATAGVDTASAANESAPTAPENAPPETGTKGPQEPAPTNAPSGEPTKTVTAPNVSESGVKPAPTPPPITTTPAVPLGEPAPAPVVAPPEAVPTPAPVAAEQAAVQQAVDKTATTPPASTPPPETASPAISPAQAESEALAAKEAPVQQVVANETPSTNVTFKQTDNPLKGEAEPASAPAPAPTSAPAEPTPQVPSAKGEGTDESGNPVGRLPDRVRALASKVNVMRKTNTQAGNELADRVEATDARIEDLRAGWMHQLQNAFNLSDKDFRDAWDLQEGKRVTKASSAAKQAATDLKSVMPQVHEVATKAGVVDGNLGDTYMPHHSTNDFAPNSVKMPDSVNATAKQYGHLEQSRLTNNPNYAKSKSVLGNYLQGSAERIAQAENLGAKNEVAHALVTKVGEQGGDAKATDKALRNYIRPPSTEGGVAKTAAEVRGVLGAAQLSKAVISHAGQTVNTAVDSGIANTIKGWGKFLGKNPENEDFVSRTGVTNPQVLHGYQDQYTSVKGVLSKITAPGLNKVMKINRSVTALAYREYGNALAKAGNIDELKKLGVTGDIGSKLTDTQELQAARGGVNRTMFNSSRAKTPTLAETPGGKLVGQYRTAYAYKQTGFVYDRVLKEAANGNLKPLARFIAASAPVAAGTVALKNKISGNKDGPGGIGMTAAAALGGLPGEAALEFGRYAKSNLPGAVAGEIAPAAGTAYNLLKNTQSAIAGSPKALERQGLSMVPLVGSRLSKSLVPPSPGSAKAQVTAGAKQSNPGIYDVKDKNGKPAFATLEGQNLHSYSTLQDAQLAQAKNEAKYKNIAFTDQQALDKAKFINSGQREQHINGMVYQNEGNGKVSSMQQKDYDYNQADQGMSLAKTSGDLKTYLASGKTLLGNIGWQLKHADLTDSQRTTLTQKATTVQADMAKYSQYGGFTKGSASDIFKAAGIPSGNATLTPRATTGLTAGTVKYVKPTLAAYTAPTAKNGNPFVHTISATAGVKP